MEFPSWRCDANAACIFVYDRGSLGIFDLRGGCCRRTVCRGSGYQQSNYRNKKPKTDQDKRITQLEARVNAMEGFLRNDKQRLDRMDEGQHVTMQALLALLDHNLDGNNIDQMQKAKEALQKHLIG